MYIAVGGLVGEVETMPLLLSRAMRDRAWSGWALGTRPLSILGPNIPARNTRIFEVTPFAEPRYGFFACLSNSSISLGPAMSLDHVSLSTTLRSLPARDAPSQNLGTTLSLAFQIPSPSRSPRPCATSHGYTSSPATTLPPPAQPCLLPALP